MKIILEVDGERRTVENSDPLFAFSNAHAALGEMQQAHADAQAAKIAADALAADRARDAAKKSKPITVREVTPSAVVDE